MQNVYSKQQVFTELWPLKNMYETSKKKKIIKLQFFFALKESLLFLTPLAKHRTKLVDIEHRTYTTLFYILNS